MSQIEALFDTVETPLDSIDASGLACDLRLKVADLSHDVSHRGLERGDARLEFCNVSFDFVDNAPDVAQMFENDIIGSFRHDVSLTNSESYHHLPFGPVTDATDRALQLSNRDFSLVMPRESGASSKHRHGWKAPWCPIAIRSLLDRPPSRAMTAKERMTVKSEGGEDQWLNYRVSME